MQYRSVKDGAKISILGYGCMRFTQGITGVNLKKTEEEILEAYRLGVNYFDTAYIYPGSEAALGEILEKNAIRDKVNIATKLPHYLLKKPEDAERYFAEECKRLRTDYVDFYLMHMLTDDATWLRLKELGIESWLEEKKKSGAIRRVGFSYHGNTDTFKKLVDAYDWDFCMIQYNYLDEHSQAGADGLHYAAEKGLPVMIMEPLRGGRLVKGLPKKAVKAMEEFPVKRSPAEWGFRWLWDQKEVTVVLSGMNSLEMVRENCRAADEARAGEFGEAERELLSNVVKEINSTMKVGCTGCRYCMPCPQKVDIPGAFAAYNRRYTDGYYSGMKDYFMGTALRKDSTGASNCIGCGKCEKHCPQGIKIREELKKVKRKMEGPVYKIGRKVFRLVMKY